jgi:hypothetical protein
MVWQLRKRRYPFARVWKAAARRRYVALSLLGGEQLSPVGKGRDLHNEKFGRLILL